MTRQYATAQHLNVFHAEFAQDACSDKHYGKQGIRKNHAAWLEDAFHLTDNSPNCFMAACVMKRQACKNDIDLTTTHFTSTYLVVLWDKRGAWS
jgi:hypothetical protein